MCGICGVYNTKADPVDSRVIDRMTSVLRHRGPDDVGTYHGEGVALGMTRLAVIDVSSTGHQPMSNEEESLWTVFNGEIYNHRELRRELMARGHRYRSTSDTETLLHTYEEYGSACLQRLRGMYGFALWDARQRSLFLAVDRLGVKPLYYSHLGDTFLWASEIKAILQHPLVQREIDFRSMDEYLRYGCVPAPRTIFQGIHRLLPGHYMVVAGGQVAVHRYWSASFKSGPPRHEREWVEETRALARACVQDQLESDVPLGALLSGGIDSGSIVAFMSEASVRPVKTFTIGFSTAQRDYGHFDETSIARRVAERFGCEHHEMVVEPRVMDVLPDVLWHFDEPFANVTAIPTWYLCQMTRQHVTVALGGVGGDESFGGYPRYLAARFLPLYFSLPSVLREGLLARAAGCLPQSQDGYSLRNRAQRFLRGTASNPSIAYANWTSQYSSDLLARLYTPALQSEIAADESPLTLDRLLAEPGEVEMLNRIFYADLNGYLADNLLVYSDRMSSAHGLELRVPFCDHRLVEFAASIPPGLKMKRFTLKYLMKKALAGVLPEEVLYGRKQGFSVPLGSWLRNELLPLMTASLSFERIKSRGYFDPSVVQEMLAAHVSGKADHSARLWALMVFDLWHTLYIDSRVLDRPSFSLTEAVGGVA